MSRDYPAAGVKDQGEALAAVVRRLGPTLEHSSPVLTGFGHYAAVLRLTDDLALALCTDSVGSKTMIASALDRYDTVGFDCVAMNVNDLLCVGAHPLALVDYLGVNTLDDSRTDQILEGLAAAAAEAGISIPGGEIAQLPGVIGSDGTMPGDERAFDLVGTAVGTLHPDRLVLGRDITPGDLILGLHSTGIHSNGLSLARRTLLDSGAFHLDDRPPGLARRLGDELLEPTRIYVRAVLSMWDRAVTTKGLAHITSDGLINLCRLEAEVTYRIESLPPAPPVFSLIQTTGALDDAEMFRVFNMGVGFVVVVDAADIAAALTAAIEAGCPASAIGAVEEGPRRVIVAPHRLVGRLAGGVSGFDPA